MSGIARDRLGAEQTEPARETDVSDADRELVGWALVGCGALDVLTGFVVLAPRLPEGRRRVVVAAMATSGLMVAILGGCFLARLF